MVDELRAVLHSFLHNCIDQVVGCFYSLLLLKTKRDVETIFQSVEQPVPFVRKEVQLFLWIWI